jgi:hypothetical protein
MMWITFIVLVLGGQTLALRDMQHTFTSAQQCEDFKPQELEFFKQAVTEDSTLQKMMEHATAEPTVQCQLIDDKNNI